jgi:hypothetical protein
MAAGGGHWMKSPWSDTIGNTVFMPAGFTQDGDSYKLGQFTLSPAELGGYILESEDGYYMKFNQKHTGLMTMAGLQASGTKDPSKQEDMSEEIYDTGIKIIKSQAFTEGATPMKIYDAFMYHLQTWQANPIASPAGIKLGLGKATPAPSGGLFED